MKNVTRILCLLFIVCVHTVVSQATIRAKSEKEKSTATLQKSVISVADNGNNIAYKSNENLNLMTDWAGNGATGEGSSPNNFGWKSEPSVTFANANGSIDMQYKSFLYRDFEGERGVVSGLDNIFMFPVNLEKEKSYECSASFSYFDSSTTGNVPFFIQNASGTKIAETEVASVTHVSTAYRTTTLAFSVPENGLYYVAYKNPVSGKRLFVKNFKLEAVTDLSLSSLSVNTGHLSPAFSPEITSYTLLVPSNTEQVNIEATPNNQEAQLSGVGSVELSSGNGKGIVEVSDATGRIKRYVINIVATNNIISTNNVSWDSQSENSAESMPLVGGDIGCNVWVENGDILFYIQRSGSISEIGEHLKLGRVRVTLTPNPLKDPTSFNQELILKDGYIKIEGMDKQLNGLNILAKLWVDVHNPVVHVDIESSRDIDVTVAYESWRTADKNLGNPGGRNGRFGAYGLEGYPGSLIRTKDIIEPSDTAILFYHRNELGAKVFPDANIELTGMGEYADRITDDTKNRIFGGLLFGNNLQADGTSSGSYQSTAYQSWKFKSKAASKQHRISIATHIECTETAQQWKDNLFETVEKIQATPQMDFDKTVAWWNDFWQRSYIHIQPQNPDPQNKPWQIGRNYQLFRYQLGGNAYGEYPTKFNGGNLTFDSKLVNSGTDHGPDWRQWGGGVFTAQNQRLLYWPMLKSGDFDAIKPQFELYKKGLAGAKARVEKFFGHEGAAFCEYATMSGIPIGDGWGWESNSANHRLRGTEIPFGDSRATATTGYSTTVEKGIMANGYISYHWESQVEHAYMILEYHRFTGADISEYMPFIEESLIFFDEHYRLREKIRNGKELDKDGKLVFYPSTACETYRGATNPADLISGLKACLKSILELDEKFLLKRDKSYYREFLDAIPDYTYGVSGNQTYIKPAKSWVKSINDEQPELYPLFPFNQFKLGDKEIDYFKKAYEIAPDKSKTIISWNQNGIQMARMGMTNEAADYSIRKMENSSRRFPTFWGPGYDWAPDHNWGGSGIIGIQEMLMQTFDKQIMLFPAWPKDWDVDFKLHAPYNTIVEGKLRDGVLTELNVTPEERKKDVINMYSGIPTNITVGINSSSIKIYPNPTSTNFVKIDTGGKKIAELQMYDMTGKCIKKIADLNVENYQLNCIGMKKNIYVLKIKTNENNTFTEKLIIL